VGRWSSRLAARRTLARAQLPNRREQTDDHRTRRPIGSVTDSRSRVRDRRLRAPRSASEDKHVDRRADANVLPRRRAWSREWMRDQESARSGPADLKVRLYVSILPTLFSSSVQQREPSFSFHIAYTPASCFLNGAGSGVVNSRPRAASSVRNRVFAAI
jgi:hypothetical protein